MSLLSRFLLGFLCAASAIGAPIEIVSPDFRGAVQPQSVAENASQPVIATGHNGRWLVWEENGGLQKQHNVEPAAALSGAARAASLATLPDGRVFAVWENTATDAVPLGAEILP